MVDDRNQVRRKRSPRYPYINLEQAIDLSRQLYNAEGYNYAPVSVALEHMNYSPTSGSGVRVLAALLQFGLLDEQGTGDDKLVQLSNLSMPIIEVPDASTRLSAIREAALNPTIHQELWAHLDLDRNQLPSDLNMRYTLLREFGFHKNAVDSFIDEFKSTYFYAKLDELLHLTPEEPLKADNTNDIPGTAESESGRPTRVQQVPVGMKEHPVQLIRQPMARLILPHPLTEQNLEHLRNWLEFMGPALTEPEDEY